ncbi:hypothetical protein [Clostridium botulinum]|uniref:hypothetical protein n=1 Tax=Clostridium botulinum TaxID=1491 RepID=UPI00077495C0|nr:hypothetical protein [Clostridium botulinum]APH20911.1 hypothetical protein NPD1_4173 [Clostridium botulinum]APQ71294.1 hypothetical protein RSJ8_4130 [Clostridium botulinum]MBN3379260.1 hypothetical protein [Clostridium botulinum]
MSKQIKIHELNVKNTMNINIVKGLEGCKKGDIIKYQNHNIKFFKNNKIITCVISNKFEVKGIGIAKCHPDDFFDIKYGVILAELRARENFYKNLSKRRI